jgi:CheY-like chemotaxis protein
MRLDFNVLWVEDQTDNVQSQRVKIERQLKKEGFRLHVEFASSVRNATAFLSDDIYGDHVDLILMDYDLGAGTKGDNGLVKVREIIHYKDIIFYSAYASQLEEKVAKLKVQGVYCSTRDYLPETVYGVFESQVKKVLDIDHARGIVMGASSDIDYCVNNCLVAIFDSSDGASQSKTLDTARKHMKEKQKDCDKVAKKIDAIAHVKELLDKHNVYTSNDRLRLLSHAIDISGLHKDKSDAMKIYMKNTIPKRNDLAHVRVEVNGFSRKLIDRSGKEFTNKKMKELRLELLNYQELFEALLQELGSKIQTQT